MKYLNWFKLLQVILGFFLIAAINASLLGWLIKIGLEKGGEAIFGARSEISKLTLNVLDGNFLIYNWRVANKNEPMKNLFQIGRIATRLNVEQLMYKRFVMNEFAVENIMLGTTRNYSGALPAKKTPPKKEQEKVDLGKIAKSLDIDPSRVAKSVSQVNLKAKDELPKINKQNEQLINETNAKLNSYDPEKELKKIDFSAFEDISNIKSLPELQDRLKKLENISKELQEIQKSFNTTKAFAEKNSAAIQANLAKIKELKNADLASIYAKLDLGNYDLTALGRAMLGPKVNSYIDTGLTWLSLAQKYMPPKKVQNAKPKRERSKGVYVTYPNNKTMPRFLIRRIALSGKTSQETPNELFYSGQVLNITSEPVLWGKPMTLEIKGKFTKRPASELRITGLFDHTKDTAVDIFELYISGYDLQGIQLIDSIPARISKGTGIISGQLKFAEEKLAGKFSFIGKELSFENNAKGNNLETIIANAISGAKEIRLDILISGTLESPDIRLTTNLDKLISDALSKVYNEKMEALRREIEAEYNKIIGEAQKKAEAQIAAQQKAINEQLAKQQAAIDQQKELLEMKKKEIEKQIEIQKNQTTKELGRELDKLKQGLPQNLLR